MTGYGRAKTELPVHLVSIEISSVNKRNLEAVFSGPKEWQAFEQHAIQLMRKQFDRGRIRISLNVEQVSQSQNDNPFDEESLTLDLQAIQSFMEKRGQDFVLSPELIVQVANLRKREAGIPGYEEAFPFLEKALLQAIKELKFMRAKEGMELSEDLKNRTEILSNLLKFNKFEIDDDKYKKVMDMVVNEEKRRKQENIRNVLLIGYRKRPELHQHELRKIASFF